MQENMKDKYVSKEFATSIHLFEFEPRNSENLRRFIAANPGKPVHYFARPGENFGVGHFVASVLLNRNFQPMEALHLISSPDRYVRSTGLLDSEQTELREFLLDENSRQAFFPPSFVTTMDQNTRGHGAGDYVVNYRHEGRWVGHLWLRHVEFPFFGPDPIPFLLRFVTHHDHRHGDLKELMLQDLSAWVPAGAPLGLQVFRGNELAERFFRRRLGAEILACKWETP